MDLWNLREPFSAWSHASWFALSFPATLWLCYQCEGGRAKRLSLLVFGFGLAACYLGSTLFHGVRGGPDRINLFDRLDHVGIHLLIAGSYTPVAVNLLHGRWRVVTMGTVWGTTAVACTFLLMNVRLPVPLATCEYLVLGWGAIFCYVEIARTRSHRVLWPLVAGGVFYSVGAVLNLLHWPAPWPGVVGPHEVFHLWVMAGSAAHFAFMLTVVVPAGVVPLPERSVGLPRPGATVWRPSAACRALFERAWPRRRWQPVPVPVEPDASYRVNQPRG